MISHVPGHRSGKRPASPPPSRPFQITTRWASGRGALQDGVDWVERLEISIARHPAIAVAVGLSVGVWFGWLIKQQHG